MKRERDRQERRDCRYAEDEEDACVIGRQFPRCSHAQARIVGLGLRLYPYSVSQSSVGGLKVPVAPWRYRRMFETEQTTPQSDAQKGCACVFARERSTPRLADASSVSSTPVAHVIAKQSVIVVCKL